MKEYRLEILILTDNDVITTSTSECELLSVEHFKLGGIQEFPGECFSGTKYTFNQQNDVNRNQYIGSFADQSGTPGWYHVDPDTSALVWCEHQDHNEFLNNYQAAD